MAACVRVLVLFALASSKRLNPSNKRLLASNKRLSRLLSKALNFTPPEGGKRLKLHVWWGVAAERKEEEGCCSGGAGSWRCSAAQEQRDGWWRGGTCTYLSLRIILVFLGHVLIVSSPALAYGFPLLIYIAVDIRWHALFPC